MNIYGNKIPTTLSLTIYLEKDQEEDHRLKLVGLVYAIADTAQY